MKRYSNKTKGAKGGKWVWYFNNRTGCKQACWVSK